MSHQKIDIKPLRLRFESKANDKVAAQQKAYMKGQFSFYGLKAPVRRELQKEFLKDYLKDRLLNKDLCRELWAQDEREYQMTAIDYILRTKRSWQVEDLDFFLELIQTKSWWDTVDAIAANMVGPLIMTYPVLKPAMQQWNQHDDMWVVRSSIIYQLKYKEAVDFDELTRFIRAHADSTEFFIRKASGWALRDCARHMPDEVLAFVRDTKLSGLTVREATKHLKDH